MNESHDEVRTALVDARRSLKQGRDGDALAALQRTGAVIHDDVTTQTQCARLARELSDRLADLPALKVAFLGEVTLDHLVGGVGYRLLLEGIRLVPLIVPFGTARQEIRDPASALYRFEPDVVWLFSDPRALRLDPGMRASQDAAEADVRTAVKAVRGDAEAVGNLTRALVIVNNMPSSSTRVYGNLESSLPGSSTSFLLRYNEVLARSVPPGAVVFDIAHVAAAYGLERWEDARLWHYSKHPFSLAAHDRVALAGARLLAAARGRARKCIVVDLDNTLWGGVVGDDGVEGLALGVDGGPRGEAYAGFQTWLRALSRRGVAVAIASKNDLVVARDAFARHRGMVLQWSDIASFRINWDNKADNIRAIARELNIGTDSIVFVDDNPAERALVRAELPEVAVPELPDDPADYVAAVAAGRWFESLGVSDEDERRTALFRENAARAEEQASSSDLPTYLRSLRMSAVWGPVDDASIERVTQLVNKTNQFHLTTTRYTLAEIRAMASGNHHWIGRFSLLDRFGDNGIIAVVILRFEGDAAIIDTWAMSCRVFARTMEHFTFACVVRVARERGCSRLVGRYARTAKNGVVAELYPSLGGRSTRTNDSGSEWEFALDEDLATGSDYVLDASEDAVRNTTISTGASRS
jgi:FkbH-like protein